MNENKKLPALTWDAFRKLPPLDVESFDWTQDIAAIQYIREHGSQEDKKKLHEMTLSFQKIDGILKKVIQRNENKRNSQ